jgi:hypothetical protein
MQILVFVILTVFYAVGSIVKAKANKTALKEKKQIPPEPVSKAPESTIDLQMLKQLFGLPEKPAPISQTRPQVTKPQAAKPQAQPTRRRVARPSSLKLRRTSPATARSAVTSPQPAGMAMLEPQMAKSQVAMPQVQPKLEKVPGLAIEAAAPTEIPQIKYLSEILSDYDDPEKLRRAILHYEILGKPISLREPEGR